MDEIFILLGGGNGKGFGWGVGSWIVMFLKQQWQKFWVGVGSWIVYCVSTTAIAKQFWVGVGSWIAGLFTVFLQQQ